MGGYSGAPPKLDFHTWPSLDPATEQRIERELDRGDYRSPAEVIEQALDPLQTEEEWLELSKSALNTRLEQSMAQIDRCEGIPGDRLLEVLAERRQSQDSRA